jgi:hypothetical protein
MVSATTARPPAQKRRRTPGGLAFSEEKARPDANETPNATKGRHFGDHPGQGDGRRKREAVFIAPGDRPWRGAKPRGGSSLAIGNNRWFATGGTRWLKATDFRRDQHRAAGQGSRVSHDPLPTDGGLPPNEARANGRPARRRDECAPISGRENLRRGNPMSVTGMKQGRTAPGGSNRQEGAKP